MKKKLMDKLAEFGLTEKEARVYISLLSGSEMTADQLAKEADMNRSTTYLQIKSLQQKGLVSEYKLGKKTLFASESPSNLERLLQSKLEQIEQQRQEIRNVVPELLKLYGSATDRPTVRIFEGKEGMTSMRNEILEEQPKLILAVTSIEQMRRIYSPTELQQFTDRREKLGIDTKVFYLTSEAEKALTPFKHQKLKEVTKDQLPFGSDIYIYNDSVSFASTAGGVVGVTIVNRDIAETCRAMFEAVWNQR